MSHMLVVNRFDEKMDSIMPLMHRISMIFNSMNWIRILLEIGMGLESFTGCWVFYASIRSILSDSVRLRDDTDESSRYFKQTLRDITRICSHSACFMIMFKLHWSSFQRSQSLILAVEAASCWRTAGEYDGNITNELDNELPIKRTSTRHKCSMRSLWINWIVLSEIDSR